MSALPTNRDEAREAGRKAAEACQVPLHDIDGHMRAIGIPQELRGSYLSGIEDHLEGEGFDTDPDSDGYGWERRALARAE